MAPHQKGKQGTKGGKQIVDENKGTLSFYRNMALGSAIASLLVNCVCYDLTKTTIFMSLICLSTMGAAYQFMVFMSKATYSESGALLDCGNDLNLDGGIAENVKDLIILASGTMLLALLSNYFWLLLLLAPIRALWMLWGSIIQPWLASQPPNEQEVEVDEKKQRKMERKMRRMR